MKATLRDAAFPLLLSASIVASSPGAERPAFEASGFVETIAGTTNRRAFALATDGSNLLIRLNACTDDKGCDYSEFGTDGTNGFNFSKTLLQADPSAPRGLRNDATMHIDPSPIPRATGVIQYLWLPYAGQSELKGRTNAFLKPLGILVPQDGPFDQELLRMLNGDLLLRAAWDFEDQAPYSLKWFVDYRDGKLESDRFSQSPIPAEFMTGRTNSRMDVLSWTNVAGLRIPIRAHHTTYITDTSKPGQPLQVHWVHHVVATNVIAGSTRRDFVPRTTKATEVIDYRFAEGRGQPARYLATNGIILGTWEEAWAEAQRPRERPGRKDK